MALKDPLPKALPLSDIPGMAEALNRAKSKQLFTRESALLSLSHDLCGIKVRTMTIRDYVLLDRLGSPFISRTEPTLDDLAMFLWVVSPQFNNWLDRKLLGFLQPVAALLHGVKVRRKFGKDMPSSSEALVVACFEYIDKMFYDSPPALASGGESCISYLTGWFDTIQSEYHYSTDQVWSMGLPELFQRLNAIRQRNNPSTPTFNKGTDSIKLYILRGLRSKEFTLEDLAQGRVEIPSSFLN